METIHTAGCYDAMCRHLYGTDDVAWTCNRCERDVGYCMGAADDMPGLCDDCAAEVGHVEDLR